MLNFFTFVTLMTEETHNLHRVFSCLFDCISPWVMQAWIQICCGIWTNNILCLCRDTVLSSSVSSDESEIDANSNDDAVDGERVMLNLSGQHHFSITYIYV